jgi:hypothetical protein
MKVVRKTFEIRTSSSDSNHQQPYPPYSSLYTRNIGLLPLSDPAVSLRVLFSSTSLVNYQGYDNNANSTENFVYLKPLINPLITEGDLIIPKVLVFLVNNVLINNGFREEGIFRKNVARV